jgi:hypothetical protein
MIARPLPAPRTACPERTGGRRTARNASAARKVRARRMRYRLVGRTLVAVGVVTTFVLVYLSLVANITRLSYDVSRAKVTRTRLALATMRGEDEIARLESRDRLEAIATRHAMHEPTVVSVVELPPRHKGGVPGAGLALLSPVGVADWLK